VNVKAVIMNLSVSKKSVRPFARHRTLKSDFSVSLMFSKVLIISSKVIKTVFRALEKDDHRVVSTLFNRLTLS